MNTHDHSKRRRDEFGQKPGSEMLKASKINPERLDIAGNESETRAKIAKAVQEVRGGQLSSDLLDALVRVVKGGKFSKFIALLTVLFVFSASLEKTSPDQDQSSLATTPMDNETPDIDERMLSIIHSLDDESTAESSFHTTVVGGPAVSTPTMEGSNKSHETTRLNSGGKEIIDVPLSEDLSSAGNEYARTYEPRGDIDVMDTANEIQSLLQAGAKKVIVKITGFSSFEHGAGTKKEADKNDILSGKRGAKGEKKLIKELQARGIGTSNIEIVTEAGGVRIHVDGKDYSEQEAIQHLMGQLGKTEKQVRKLIKQYNRSPYSVSVLARGLFGKFLADNRSTIFEVMSVGDIAIPPTHGVEEIVKTTPPTNIAPKPTPAPITSPPIPSPRPVTIGGTRIAEAPLVQGGADVDWFARDPEGESQGDGKPKKPDEPDGEDGDSGETPDVAVPLAVLGDSPPEIIDKINKSDTIENPKPVSDITPDITPGFSDIPPVNPDNTPPPPPDEIGPPPKRIGRKPKFNPDIPPPDKTPPPEHKPFTQPSETTPTIPPTTPELPPVIVPPVKEEDPPIPPVLPDEPPPVIPPIQPDYPPYVPRPIRPNLPPLPPPQPPEGQESKYGQDQWKELQPMGTPTRTAKKDLLGGQHDGEQRNTGRRKVKIDKYGDAVPLDRREFAPNVEKRHRGDRGISAKIKDQWKKIAQKFKKNQRGY